MKLKSLLLCSFLGLSLFAQAETVHVLTAGSLKTLVDTTGRVIDDLTLTGSVNRSDLRYLRNHVKKLNLKDVTIAEETVGNVMYPDNVMPDSVFMEDKVLANVVLPSGIVEIGKCAFEEVRGTAFTVDFSNCKHLQTIRNNAFSESSLQEVNLNGLTALQTIDAYAFYWTDIKHISLEGCSSLVMLGERAFCNDYFVTSVNLKGCTSLQTVGNRAFLNLAKQSGDAGILDFSETAIESFDESSLQSSKVTTVIFPATLRTLGAKVLNLSKVANLKFLGNVPPVVGSQWMLASALKRAIITVPAGKVKAYADAFGLSGADAKNLADTNGATLGINGITTAAARAQKCYNLAGQRVGKGYKGIVIANGKKVVR